MPAKIIPVDEQYTDFLRDESRRSGCADRICFPSSVEEVQDAIAVARANKWSVTVQGGRTGIAGGGVPDGGLILNLSRMKAIGEIHGNLMHVEPGVVLDEIRSAVHPLYESPAQPWCVPHWKKRHLLHESNSARRHT